VTHPDVAAIVLAGGASRRFGRDKLREDLRGEPLLAHAIRRLAEVAPEIHVIVTQGDPLPRLPADLAVDLVRDLVAFDGPLRATARGLSIVHSTWAIVAGGDMPELQPTVLTALLRLGSDRDASATALGEGDRFRPLPCVLRTAPARERAESLLAAGERSLRALLQDLSVAVLDETAWVRLDPERRTLRDVDEPADLLDAD
jgi:molybdopterin-guanine dinucleotide biosynthesis protein A